MAARATRGRPKKTPPPEPVMEAMVDTLVEEPVEEAPKRPRQQKAGPKKVISETTRIVGDGMAAGVLLITSGADARKNMTMEEAQSIGHPVTRILSRRLPAWLKPFLPKTKMNEADAADVEEILATLGKWGMRLAMVLIQDFVMSRERAQQAQQAKQATEQAKQAQHVANGLASQENDRWHHLEARMKAELAKKPGGVAMDAAAIPSVQQNGHNPAFDILPNIDLGIEV